MADSDKTLEILIKLGVIGQDDVRAANDLLKETVKATGKNTEETKEAAQAAEGFNFHSRETRLLFSELNKLAPGLGHELHAAFTGPTGAVILLAIALASVKSKLDDYNKSLDEAGDRDMQPVNDAVAQLQTAWDDAKKKVGEYEAAVANAGKNRDPIDEQIKQEKELTDAKLEGIKKIIEALGRQEVARLRANGGSPEEVAAAEQRGRDQIAGLDAAKNAGDAARLQEEYARRNAPGQQMVLDEKQRAAAESAASAAANLNKLQAEKGNLIEALSPNAKAGGSKVGFITQGDVDQAGELLNALRANDSGAADYKQKFALETSGKNREQIEEDYLLKTQALAEQRTRLQQLESKLEAASERKADADLQVANAESEGKRNANRVAELPSLIAAANSKDILEDASGIIARGVTAENAVQASGKVAEAQRQAIEQLNALAQISGTNMAAILRVLV